MGVLQFRASELKKMIDLLIDAGSEVIQIEKGVGRRCFINGYSPYVPQYDEYEPILDIMEED